MVMVLAKQRRHEHEGHAVPLRAIERSEAVASAAVGDGLTMEASAVVGRSPPVVWSWVSSMGHLWCLCGGRLQKEGDEV